MSSKLEFLRELRDNKDKVKLNEIERKGSNNNKIFINALIKDQKYKIYCGDGNQKLRWLTEVAIFKYKNFHKVNCGLAYLVKKENGNYCELDEIINATFQNNENVWILLKEEYDSYLEDHHKKLFGNSKDPDNNLQY
jgi:hypothetical protein